MNTNTYNYPTIIAPITPMITSAVIALRVSGTYAVDVVRTVLVDNSIELKPRYATFTSIQTVGLDGLTLKDDVILIYYKAPHSFTGEDCVELFLHGNPTLASTFIEAMLNTPNIAVQPASNGEFSERAFLNGKVNLSQAEAINELIHAHSTQNISQSYKKLHGGVNSLVDKLTKQLILALTTIEAYIDFPEDMAYQPVNDSSYSIDENSKLKSELINLITPINDTISNLQNAYKANMFIENGINILLIGAPNSGKSSLFNTLLNYNRSIVSQTAGTTRDYIKEHIIIGNQQFNLFDTAGIRNPFLNSIDDNSINDSLAHNANNAHNQIEQEGIELAKSLISKADIIIALYDITNPVLLPFDILDEYAGAIIKVATKSDLLTLDIDKLDKNDIDKNYDLTISIENQASIDELKTKLTHIANNITQNAKSAEFIPNLRQLNALNNIEPKLSDILSKLHSTPASNIEFILDRLSLELQQVKQLLGQITGNDYSEDILNSIFSQFCIGK